jgi:hypothetical protein
MAVSNDVYITVGLDRQGNVVEVLINGQPANERSYGGGASTSGGDEETVKPLRHELVTRRKKGDTNPGTDPCCYRDPATGRIWCWC